MSEAPSSDLLNGSSQGVANVTGNTGVSLMDIPEWMEIVYATFLALLFCTIVTSSLLVLTVVATNSKLHSLPGYLMAALAICDLVMAITSIIPSVLTIIWDKWLFTRTGCYMQAYCQTYGGTLESSFIMLCALDRFSAIRSPLFYSQLEIYVLRYLKLVLAITILINLPIPTAAAIVASSVEFNPQFSHCVYSFDGEFVVPFLNYVLQYILPGLVIIFCYSYIAVAAIRSKKQHLKATRGVGQNSRQTIGESNAVTHDTNGIDCPGKSDPSLAGLQKPKQKMSRNNSSSNTEQSHSFFRHLKLCKMLFVITFVYILSFLPIFVYGFLVAFSVLPFNIYIYKVMHFLTYINGASNAFIYYSMSVVFKQGFHRTMSRFFPSLSLQHSRSGTEALDFNNEMKAAEGSSNGDKTGAAFGKGKKKHSQLMGRTKIELDV